MKKFEYSFKALWTVCSIIIINENDYYLTQIINDCYKNIINFEKEFSRFKEDSFLSKLNKTKKEFASKDFLDLLAKSKKVYEFTNWYFNPFINLNKIWYSGNFEEKVFEKKFLEENLEFEKIKINWNIVELNKNSNLDFWAIAKGYLSHKISNELNLFWYKNNFVNLWWDIFASWLNLEWKKWQIAISSPFEEKKEIEVLEISDESVSTSWTYLRKWQIWKEKFHHIRNPFLEKQETELVSVTIINKDGYLSDSYATAIIAMWKEKWLEFVRKNNLNFIFILDNWEVIKH